MDSDRESYHQTRSSNGDGSDSAAQFQRLTGQIRTNIQTINQYVQQMQQMVGQSGTPKDSEELRHRLYDTEHTTREVSQKTSQMLKDLKDLPNEQRQWKLQRERLTNELMAVLKNFQSAQQQTVEKEKASIKRVRAAISAYDADQQPPYDEPFRGQQQQQLQVVQNDPDSDPDPDGIKKRQQALSQLESDISDVNQIFKILALMVHEQGEIVDNIEASVDHTVVHVEQGASNVQRAAN
uniref:t-SNARE coiled-coil homology domain-containing protein n=1 Tax=Plectus sambesii TaxID=2011161 RepID=A0A914VMX5_9BILA